jgi:hypothetical protein
MVNSEWEFLFTIHHFTIHPRAEGAPDFPSIIGGFPHSEIAGSKLIRSSPTLIAAYHVLHRLCMPRHPPIALKTLDHSHCQYPSVFRLRMVLVQKVLQLLGGHAAPFTGCDIAILKRPASRDLSDGAVRQPIMGRGLSVHLRRTKNP